MSTGKKLRRHFKVERLPERLQVRVDRGLAEGKSYLGIAEEVTQAGHPISETAIRHYWRQCWQPQHERIQWLCAQSQALAQALRHTGESDEAVLARKLLIGQLLSRMEGAIKKMEFPDLLAESREMVKATRHLDSKSSAKAFPSPQQIEREVREIYGWTQEELEPEPDSPAAGSGKAES